MFPMFVFDSIEPVLLQNPCNEYSTASITNVPYVIMVTANFVWFCTQVDIKLLSNRVLLKPSTTESPTGYHQRTPKQKTRFGTYSAKVVLKIILINKKFNPI